jgi:hypothetical protein
VPGRTFEASERVLACKAPDSEERREAAESLHIGTREAVFRLDRRPGHARARALRDTCWDVTGASGASSDSRSAETVALLLACRRTVCVAGRR